MAHTPTVYRGQSTFPTGIERPGQIDFPLKIVVTRGGRPFDPSSIEFQIFQDPGGTPVQVFPVAGKQAVDLTPFPTGDRLSVGTFGARWIIPEDAQIVEHEIRWFVKQSDTDAERQIDFRFLVADYTAVDREADVLALSTGLYCTANDVREEGYQDEAKFRAKRIDRLIQGASRDIERYTGRWFEPRTLDLVLDGSGAKTLEMPGPPIEIKEVRVLSGTDPIDTRVIDLQDIVTFNRWLKGVVKPDDRNDPRIALVTSTRLRPHRTGIFPRGEQNIQVSGIFGYTDRDVTVGPYGTTPEAIRRCCVLMVARELPEIRDYSSREDRQRRHLLRSEKADGQTFAYERHPRPAKITGDPEIDSILVDFMAPPSMEAAGGITDPEVRLPLDGLFETSVPSGFHGW